MKHCGSTYAVLVISGGYGLKQYMKHCIYFLGMIPELLLFLNEYLWMFSVDRSLIGIDWGYKAYFSSADSILLAISFIYTSPNSPVELAQKRDQPGINW